MQEPKLSINSVAPQLEEEIAFDWIKITGYKLSVETGDLLETVQVNPDLTVTVVTTNI